VFCGCFVCLLVFFSLSHCIVCPSSFYSCLLPLGFLYTFVLSKHSTLKKANIRDVWNTIYKQVFEMTGVQYTNKYSSFWVYNMQPNIRDDRCTICKQVFEMTGVQYTTKYSRWLVYNIQPSIRDDRCTIYNHVFEYDILIFELSGVHYTNMYYNVVYIVLSKVSYISLLDIRRFDCITYEQTQHLWRIYDNQKCSQTRRDFRPKQ
jgi:hypothetical protein